MDSSFHTLDSLSILPDTLGGPGTDRDGPENQSDLITSPLGKNIVKNHYVIDGKLGREEKASPLIRSATKNRKRKSQEAIRLFSPINIQIELNQVVKSGRSNTFTLFTSKSADITKSCPIQVGSAVYRVSNGQNAESGTVNADTRAFCV